jgi:hypothetical protein
VERYVNKIPVEVQLYKLLLKKKYISAIETGTIRKNKPEHLSTFRIGKILNKRGSLISVDSSAEFIEISKSICSGLKNIIWVLSDALECLQYYNDNSFDFLLIDTFNDKKYCYDQFIEGLRIVKDDGVIMVDDAGVTFEQRIAQPKAEKGHKIVQLMNRRLLPYTLHGNMLIFYKSDWVDFTL